MAQMAHDGFARAISPVHTTERRRLDLSLATGDWTGEANLAIVGALAAEAMADAIVRAATQAESLAGVPSARELGPCRRESNSVYADLMIGSTTCDGRPAS